MKTDVCVVGLWGVTDNNYCDNNVFCCFFTNRELLRCESALARLYCRMALLNIFAPKNPHTFTRLFHIPAIRDITLEHLQLLSNQLLAPPLPGKSCFQRFSIWLGQCILIDNSAKLSMKHARFSINANFNLLSKSSYNKVKSYNKVTTTGHNILWQINQQRYYKPNYIAFTEKRWEHVNVLDWK